MMSGTRIRQVTINFLGVKVRAKFKAGRYDYSAKISLDQALACYRTALDRLGSDIVPYDLHIQLSSGTTADGKRYSVALYRYVKNEKSEDVQCMLSLKFRDSGDAELFVTYTTFGLMLDTDAGEASHTQPREVTLWSH
jgi:hypothetical protein